MRKIKTNKQSLIRWKVYIDRARMYIGYAQFLMIAFVFLEAYRETSLGKFIFEKPLISGPLVFLVFIGLSLIIGRIDTVLGLREEELRNSSNSNPIMREMMNKIDELTQEVKQLRETQKTK